MISPRYRFVLILLIFASLSCSKSEEEPAIGEQLLRAVNKLRSEGCTCGQDVMPPAEALQWNRELEVAARIYAMNMSSHIFFSHIDLNGGSPISRAKEAGYDGSFVGENIGKGYVTVAQVIKAWKASENHCKSIMDPLYLEMGAALYNGYWVMELGAKGN